MNISEYYNWWLSELTDILPTANAFSLSKVSDLQAHVTKKSYSLVWSKLDEKINCDEKFLAQSALTQYQSAFHENRKLKVQSCDFHLLHSMLLYRDITFPLATEENIKEVVSYEIDRYTPFKKEDIYYDVSVKERDKKNNKLIVTVAVVKKHVIDEILNFCEAAELPLGKLFAYDSDVGISKELSSVGSPASVAKSSSKSGTKLLLYSTIILLFAALCIPIGKNYWLASKYNHERQQMSAEVAEVKEIRGVFQDARKQAERVKNISAGAVKVTELLSELTDVIPDDTSLGRFSLEENITRIQGTSSSASKLIALLDSSNKFSDVEFVAPVTKNSDTGKENFTIQFNLISNNAAITE